MIVWTAGTLNGQRVDPCKARRYSIREILRNYENENKSQIVATDFSPPDWAVALSVFRGLFLLTEGILKLHKI